MTHTSTSFYYNGKLHTFSTAYPSDHIFSIIRKTKTFYEIKLLEKIRELGRSGVYVDVGANIGNHTVYFDAHCPSTKVIALEICPEICDLLYDNTMTCQNVQLYHKGVGERKKKASVGIINPSNIGMTKIIEDNGDNEVDTLDNILAEEKDIVVVKIDVEGYEANVIRGAKEILKQHPVLIAELQNKEEFEEFRALVESYGYHTDGVNYAHTPTYIWEVR